MDQENGWSFMGVPTCNVETVIMVCWELSLNQALSDGSHTRLLPSMVTVLHFADEKHEEPRGE